MTDPALASQNSKTAKVWDRFAQGYAKRPVDDDEAYQHKLRVTQERYLTATSHVVEFACGTGSTSLHHAPYVQHLLATDISGEMIRIAQQKQIDAGIPIEQLEFRQASVDEMDSSYGAMVHPGSKDVVLGMSILHLLPDSRADVIQKVHGWLKPGGYFVTSTICFGDLVAQSWTTSFLMKRIVPIVSWLGIIPDIDNALTKDQLRQEFKRAGFSIDYEWQPRPDAAVFMVGKKHE